MIMNEPDTLRLCLVRFVKNGLRQRHRRDIHVPVQDCILRCTQGYRMFILKNSMMARHESNESVAQL